MYKNSLYNNHDSIVKMSDHGYIPTMGHRSRSGWSSLAWTTFFNGLIIYFQVLMWHWKCRDLTYSHKFGQTVLVFCVYETCVDKCYIIHSAKCQPASRWVALFYILQIPLFVGNGFRALVGVVWHALFNGVWTVAYIGGLMRSNYTYYIRLHYLVVH